MKLSLLVILGVCCLALTTHPAEASRTKRTIGGWFSKLWKGWKKEPEPEYEEPIYVAVPRPAYRPPPVQPHYGPPPPVRPHYGPPPPVRPSYGPPPPVRPSYGPPPPVHAPPTNYHAPPIHVHHKAVGGHGHGGGLGFGGGHAIGGGHGKGHAVGGHGKGHAIGGHGHAVGGHGKGHAVGGHGKGLGGHGKGIPHGFGPVKDSDILHGGHSHQSLPPSQFSAPVPVISDSYSAPSVPVIADSYSAPVVPVIEDSYSAPSVPISSPIAPPVVHEHVGIPVVSEPSNDYRAPPSFPPPMAAHGSSSSSYLEGSFQPSQPLPIEPVVPVAPVLPVAPVVPIAPAPAPVPTLPAPPAPLYNLPVGPDTVARVPDGAPAPIDVLPPAPLALETDFVDSAALGAVPAVITDVTAGRGASGIGITDAYAAPAVDLTFGSQLGPEDPIIEIVFQDGDPIPPPPPPIFDPQLFAPPEEEVEVYFIEYAPGDNIDDIAALSLDGAQPAILHDLPQDLPVDIRSQLLGSGILDDAEIQVLDLEDALSDDNLDLGTRTALEAAFGAESRLSKSVLPPPKGDVEVKVHRLANEQGSPESTAELLSKLQNYREGRFVGLVKTGANDTKRYLPLTVDGERIPLPNTLDLSGQKVAEVLVVATNEEDENDNNSPPPANTNNPEHNLVSEASNPKPVIVAAEETAEGIDRQWHGDPNDWRPVWN